MAVHPAAEVALVVMAALPAAEVDTEALPVAEVALEVTESRLYEQERRKILKTSCSILLRE